MSPDHNLLFIAVPAFAILDLLWGSDFKWKGHSGHSVATLGAMVLAVGAFFIAGVYASAVCVAWAAYRSLPFSGGGMAPVGASQILTSFARHLAAPLLVGIILAIRYQALDWRMLVYCVYAVAATSFAVLNGATQGKMNWAVEAGRGALYGVAFTRVFW